MSQLLNTKGLLSEVYFQTSRSSGAGGQNVNKVNTKVELRFNIQNSQYLTDNQKKILLEKLSNKITTSGELIIASQASRSQLRNKENCISKFLNLITHALTPRKKRVATKPTKKSNKKRLEAKKKHSEKKQLRKGPDI